MWSATVVSNIGTWMYGAAAGWLMTNLTTDAFVVSLVQVANTLPMFLFAVVAGALSDVIDKRRLLLAGEIVTTILSAIFAALVWFNDVTPASLLWFVFFIGAAGAATSPAWQSVVTELVPNETLGPAISANSAGVNVSRAIGPALAGAIIGPFGIASPFIINAVSNLGVIGALIWWREPRKTRRLPAERLDAAIRTGFRYALHSPGLRATFARAVGFYFFASTYWALLPLVARSRISGGPEIYGILLGAIGLGAVGGTFVMPAWKAKIGADRLVAGAAAGTAVALVLFGLARSPLPAILASLIAGVSWIAAIATINVSAQASLPDWMRGRGLALYITVFFGSLTIGSAVWGQVATLVGLPIAHFAAAAGMLLAIPLTWRWKLRTTGSVDLTPSMSWPVPAASDDAAAGDGPVLVTLEYLIADPKEREPLLTALRRLRHERLRDGAYRWSIFEDAAAPGKFLETFLVDSWLEHLRQHERVTKADDIHQQYIQKLLSGEPKVTHFITPKEF